MRVETLQEKMREMAQSCGKRILSGRTLVGWMKEKNRQVKEAFMGVVKLLAAEVAAAIGGQSVA